MKAISCYSLFLFVFIFNENIMSQNYIYPSGKNINLKVSCIVREHSDTLIYNYKLKNLSDSKQKVFDFSVEIYTSVSFIESPLMWRGNKANLRKDVVRWASRDSSYDIAPSDSRQGFKMFTISLPKIVSYYAVGAFNIPIVEEGEAPEADQVVGNDYFDNSVKGYTIGPSTPPSPFVPLEFVDTLLTYDFRSFQYGWILQEQIKNKYQAYLTNAKTSLQQGDSLQARIHLQNILRDVDIDSSGAITGEAYALLKYNTEYLLSKLPVVTEPTNDLTAKAKVEITSANGSLQYSYTITNEAASNQSAANIYVEDITISTITAPANWQTEKIGTILDRFYTTTSANQITAGTTKSGYSLTSNSLPVIGKVYIQSERFAVDTLDIKTNSYIITTVTPAIKPAQINTSAFIDTLISYNNRAYSLGWMQYYWVRDNNYYQLNNAKTMINMNIPASAVVILTAFESWLDTIKNLAYINDEGYALLKYNSIFLREKLSGQ